jgi:multidrug efflux system outer membrane protein
VNSNRSLRQVNQWLWVSSLTFLGACSLAPKYERPTAPIPSQYASSGLSSLSSTTTEEAVSTTSSAAIETDWHQYFKDDRLKQLIEIALKNNRDLRQAVLKVEQLRAEYQIQRANQFPSLSATHSATRQATPSTDGVFTNSFSVGLSASWEIDLFGRISNLKEQALATYLSQSETRKAAQMSLISSVSKTWFSLLADEEVLAITQQTVKTREDSLRLFQLSFENGVISEIDLRQAESLLASAQASLAQWQRQRAQDENALALLLGQEVPANLLATAHLSEATDLPDLPTGAPIDLVTNRPDIRAAEQTLIAMNANIGVARAAFLPKLSLTAFLGTSASQYSGLFDSGSRNTSLGGQLSLPIFNGGSATATLESAKVQQQIAVAAYEKSIQNAFKEVSDALIAKKTFEDQYKAQQIQQEAENKRYELAKLRYEHGVSSYLDLLDAQRSLFSIQQSTIQTRLSQLQSQVSLYIALGGGWLKEPNQ